MKRGHTYAGGRLGSDRHTKRHYGLDAAVYVAIAATAVSAAGTAYTAYAANEAQSDAADYNKKVAQNNAALAKQQADIDAQSLETKQRRFLAAQRVAYGSSGVEDEGSPLLVMADTAREQARDLMLVHYGGDVRAANYEAEAGLQGLYSRSYSRAGAYGAGTSLLAGAAGIAQNYNYGRYGYYNYGRTGSTPTSQG